MIFKSPIKSFLTNLLLFLCCIGGMLLLPPILSFSISPSEIQEAIDNSKQYEGQINTDNIHSEEMKKEAQKTYNTYQKDVFPKVKKYMDTMRFDGRSIVMQKKENGEKEYTGKAFLSPEERIYIFISSSIPKKTLKNYAVSMDKLKDPNISMVLRGCIGGCSKLMPTASFIQSIIAPSEEDQLIAEVIIDPNLFQYYEIKRVPAIMFVRGVSPESEEVSEGVADNLKKKPDAYVLYGDVALDYALEKINTKLSLPNLDQIVKLLRKSWFQENQ